MRALLGRCLAATSAAFLWVAGTAPAQVTPAAPEEAASETYTFSIPETLLVRALYDRAQGHIEARRYGEAISDLQSILEHHSGDVLPAERPKSRTGRTSEGAVHPGAALRARALLFALPREARTLYEKRHESDAGAALEAALAGHDVHALSEVGRRWPLTQAAERALVALGDLEFEYGHEREASFAWARALAAHLSDATLAPRTAADWKALRARVAAGATAVDGAPRIAGLLRRIDSVLARPEARRLAEIVSDNEAALRLPNSQGASGPPPGENGDSWAAPFALPPHPFNDGARNPLFAVRNDERLFVSTSLRVFCLHAYTGELLWDSGEPRGWNALLDKERSDLFLGVDREASLIAPAASDAVVVAALQLPFALLRFDTYQNIKITWPIPERRLFAFDAATGRKLWDHAPPPGWDGEGGSFAQRMTIAGPPVIVGSRVLAPCVRMQGRINYNVGCFDRDTGELIWSRDVISGQREQNMFGRAQHEFCTAPLCVEGDKVIALTQLGTVACLDLFTGEILWETLHETIELPRTRAFETTPYQTVWRNCAPVVEGDVVVATPFNSRDLIALDLATGVLLWSQSQATINSATGRPSAGIELLLGVSNDAIFLGGERWVGLDMPAGLGERSRLRAKVLAREDDLVAVRSRSGRPVLASDRVVMPRLTERVDFDRVTGATLGTVPWPNGRGGGNILLGAGEMFVVSSREVQGFFEWDVLVARARTELARAPADGQRVLRLARLLDGRGASEWQRGASEPARAHFGEARAILELALAQGVDDARPELEPVYHSVLRGEARVKAGLADSSGALANLRAARLNAPNPAALRDTLVEEFAILLERSHSAGSDATASRAVLTELERSCAALPLSVQYLALADATTAPFGAEFRPLIGARAADEAIPIEMPVGLWVLIQRDALHAQSADTQGEYADLHAILADYADVDLLATPAGDLAEARIEALRALHGQDPRQAVAQRDDGYGVYEARAQALFDEGVERHDDETLKRVARLFPTSRAARAANAARLGLALDKGDLATVAGIVAGELPDDWRLRDATDVQAQRFLRLAAAFARAKNREAEGALLRALATARGSLVSDLPEQGGATLLELATRAPTFARASKALDRGRFSSTLESASERPWLGEYELLGEALPAVPLPEIAADSPVTLVFASSTRGQARGPQTLMALSSLDPTAEHWTVALPGDAQQPATGLGVWARRCAFAAGRLMVATSEGIVGIDSDTGEKAWDWRPGGNATDSLSIACASGIAVVVVTSRAERDRWSAVGLDAHSGVELWRTGVVDPNVQRMPIVSGTRAVFVPTTGHKKVVVLDLFTGTRTKRLELETPVATAVDSDAWIEGDLLIVPWFTELRIPERNHVLAVDLETGQRAWRVGFEDPDNRRWLSGVLQQAGRTWLVIQSTPNGESTAPEQSLAGIDTRIGALTPLPSIRIGPEDRILGLPRAARVEMTPGPIVLTSPRGGGGRGTPREARLRCVDLDRGELWVQGLGFGFDEITPGVSPMPALSDTTLAVVIATAEDRGLRSGGTAMLWSFDQKSGLPGGSQVLRHTDSKDIPQLSPLGATLIVKTKSQLEILK